MSPAGTGQLPFRMRLTVERGEVSKRSHRSFRASVSTCDHRQFINCGYLSVLLITTYSLNTSHSHFLTPLHSLSIKQSSNSFVTPIASLCPSQRSYRSLFVRERRICSDCWRFLTRALGESSTCVSCLHKQMPFVSSWSEVHTNTSDFRIGPSDLSRYRPILRPISFVVRYHSFRQYIRLFRYHSVHQVARR